MEKREPNFTTGASVMPTISAAATGSRIERPKCSAAISASTPISSVATSAARRHSAGMPDSGCASVRVRPYSVRSDWSGRITCWFIGYSVAADGCEQRRFGNRVPSDGLNVA